MGCALSLPRPDMLSSLPGVKPSQVSRGDSNSLLDPLVGVQVHILGVDELSFSSFLVLMSPRVPLAAQPFSPGPDVTCVLWFLSDLQLLQGGSLLVPRLWEVAEY